MRPLTSALLVVALLALGCGKKDAPDGDASKNDTLQHPSGPNAPAAPVKTGADRYGTFTIGKGTTGVIGPVQKDGHIDFAAALNERLSKGVTPEQNANVGFWKAFGPSPMTVGGGTVPPGFFDKLGIPQPPATGDYFVTLYQHTRANGPNAVKAAYETQKKYRTKPWTANTDQGLYKWLELNAKPMSVIAEAAKLPLYYNPIIPVQGPNGSRGLYSSPLPGAVACDEAGLAFACRAMLNLGYNNTAQAWQDLLTAHRIARHVGRGATLTEGVVGIKLDQIISDADLVFLSLAKPSGETVQECMVDLLALPPLPDVAEKIDVCERFAFLDTVMLANRHGYAHLEAVGKQLTRWPPGYTDDALTGIDWNPTIERANKWYDRLAAALREPDQPSRSKKLNEVDSDLVKLGQGVRPEIAKDTSQPLAARSAAVADLTFAFLIPKTRDRMNERDRAQQQFNSTFVAFACVWYQRANNKYPAALADLTPNFLREVPADLFNGKPLVFRSGEGGFEIMSVGQNGLDEGGNGNSNPGFGDDIVIRFPPWVKP